MDEKKSKIRKIGFIIVTTIAVFAICSFIFLASVTYKYHGPHSDHFDGTRFFNLESGDHSFTDMLRWMWEMETIPWPEWIEDTIQPPPPERIGGNRLRITYINHATVLIQTDSINILTDPIWSSFAGPIKWFGTKRVRAPGVRLTELPPIDFVLISHDHYDHLDLPTIEKLAKRDQPAILAGLGVKSILSAKGIPNVVEMDWWQTHIPDSEGISFTFVPSRHGSGRWPFMENRTLWGGFLIENRSGEQIYYAGDTGYGTFFNSIREKFKRIRLAILPIGNYEKRWFMKNQHMNPDDAVQAHRLLQAHQSIGIHYSTFAEHPEQAIDTHEYDLSIALEKYKVPSSQFWILDFGEGRDIPAY